jgi:hypothetical protein
MTENEVANLALVEAASSAGPVVGGAIAIVEVEPAPTTSPTATPTPTPTPGATTGPGDGQEPTGGAGGGDLPDTGGGAGGLLWALGLLLIGVGALIAATARREST